jgi:hypothetical protein
VLLGSLEEDVECEEFVARLVKSHDQILTLPFDMLTDEEVYQKMARCHVSRHSFLAD